MYQEAKLSPAEREREVGAALSRLRGGHGQMRDALDQLVGRLQIVLSPESPTKEGVNATQGYSSELAQSISNQADSAYCAANTICDLLARLEI